MEEFADGSGGAQFNADKIVSQLIDALNLPVRPKHVHIQILGDGFRAMHSTSIINIGVRLLIETEEEAGDLHLNRYPVSYCLLVCLSTSSSRILFEGEETNESLQSKLKDLKSFLDRGETVDGTKFPPWEGGDLKCSNRKSLGMSGNFATTDQCLWCFVPRSQLCSLQAYPERTLNSIRVLAHLPPLQSDGKPSFPFSCDCCDSTYTTQAQVDAESLNPEQIKAFPSLHKGVMWQQGPCTNTPIDHIVPCVLHMRLRFCSTLWEWCIAPSAMVKRADVAEKVWISHRTDLKT